MISIVHIAGVKSLSAEQVKNWKCVLDALARRLQMLTGNCVLLYSQL